MAAPDDWRWVDLKDYVYYQEGPGIRNWQYRDTGIPFVNIRCLKNGRLDTSIMSCIDAAEVSAKYDHFLLNAGDYVVSSSGTLGRVAEVWQSDLPCMLNTSVIRFRSLDESVLDRTFLKVFLQSTLFEEQILAYANGSAQLNYGPSHLAKMKLILPPIQAQRDIGDLLGALEQRIGHLGAENDTFERIAQSIFKSWFVDFDPVRAKAEGREPEGMDAATAALLPSEFQQSERGPIPTGWTAGRLGDVCEIARSVVQKADMFAEDNYVGLEHIPRESWALADWGTAEDLQSGKSRFVQGDILFGKLRPYFHKVCIAPVDGVCSTDILVLRPEPIWKPFVLCHASSRALIDYATRLSNGAKMPRTKWQDLYSYAIAVPPERLAEVFADVVQPIVHKIVENVHTAKTLADLRDALLPRLISGKLRVPEAEKLVETVV